MGVKIKDILTIHQIELKDLEGSIVAVDGPNVVMSLLSFSYKKSSYFNSKYMIDRTRRIISHLYGLLYRINFYYSKKILPIFCFDGCVHPYKRLITKDKLHDFQYIKQKYKEAIENHNYQLAQQIATGKEFLWINTIQESKKMLSYLGIPYVESPASAESQCACLVKDKVVDFTISQDFDCLVFGSLGQVRNLSKSRVRKINNSWQYTKVKPSIIKLKENLKKWGIDIFQLVDIAMLIGTDYNKGIMGIGPKLALRFIKKFGHMESVIKNCASKFDFSKLNEKKIAEIRKIFLFPEVISKYSNFNWNYPQMEKIMEFLCEDHTLNSKRIKNNIIKFTNNYEKCTSFFKNKKLITLKQRKLFSFI